MIADMIPLVKSAFVDDVDTREALADFIRSTDRLSMGPQCLAFERAFCEYQGCKYAVLMNSGASANLALLQALKNMGALKADDNVGFSAVTWSTNVMPIIQMGFNPVPVDVDPTTINVNYQSLFRVTDTLQAMFITNAMGMTGDFQYIKPHCLERGILLLEDNCEALGTERQDGRSGNFGTASTFSFYVAHHLSTIEGGMVCTNDHVLADMLRLVRANGWDRNLPPERQQSLRQHHDIGPFDAPYAFYDLGYNFRPTEITGFLGCNQLAWLPQAIQGRKHVYDELASEVVQNSDLRSLNTVQLSAFSPFAFPVLCWGDRQKYLNRFQEAGVEVRPIIGGNMTRQPFYRKYARQGYHLPGADFVHDHGFYFACRDDFTDSEIAVLKGCLRP